MFSKKIILGSSSPRRKELLLQLGFPTEIRKVEVEEKYPPDIEIENIPEYLAKLKAIPLKNTIKKEEMLLTSDTAVILGQQVLGKPKNREEALQMLQRLSGNFHFVVSGVCLFSLEQETSFSVTTKVFFKSLSSEEIEYYVDKWKPFDKAGSYGIQEWIGMIGVRKIEGCYYNVMGLPVNKIWEVLQQDFL